MEARTKEIKLDNEGEKVSEEHFHEFSAILFSALRARVISLFAPFSYLSISRRGDGPKVIFLPATKPSRSSRGKLL